MIEVTWMKHSVIQELAYRSPGFHLVSSGLLGDVPAARDFRDALKESGHLESVSTMLTTGQ
jgi:hypothetical protein